MSPLLTGVLASQISGHLNTYTLTGSYDALATVTVPSGGASSITFSAIPQTGYKHLQIRTLAKNSETASYDEAILASFNGDTTYTNYRQHYLVGNGTSASSGSVQASGWIGNVAGGATGATPTSCFAVGVCDILDYGSSNKNKVIRTLYGTEVNQNNTNSDINLWSGIWLNTAPITSINLTCVGGFNFSQYSQFSLYGIK